MQCALHRESVDQERVRSDGRFSVMPSAFEFPQCFDTVD